MNENVKQHSKKWKRYVPHNIEAHLSLESFEVGLTEYKTYLLSLSGNERNFSAVTLLKLIDSFAPALMSHLREEIPSLLSLSRFGTKIPLLKLSEVEMRKASNQIPKTEGLPFFLMNLDRTFENGKWESWPPIPAPVRWTLIRILAWKHADWWRFASCDYDGYPKKLYAMGKTAAWKVAAFSNR